MMTGLSRVNRMAGGFQKVETVDAGGPLIVIYAKDLEAMGADSICIKDMAGLLKPTGEYKKNTRNCVLLNLILKPAERIKFVFIVQRWIIR